jgi:hypothetical protein
MRKPLTGAAYTEFLERTAARVSTWPAWKTGERAPMTMNKHHHAPVPMVGVEGCRICGDPVKSHLEPDLRNYSIVTIEGRNNILFRIFADAHIPPPTEDATAWGNALAWLENAVVDAREYQRRVDQEELEAEAVLAAKKIHFRFPSAKDGMELPKRGNW